MKKSLIYFVLWFMLTDFANHTENKIFMAISCVLGIFMLVYIIKTNTQRE